MRLSRRAFQAGVLAGAIAPGMAVAAPSSIGFVGCYTTGEGPPDLGQHRPGEGVYSFALDTAGRMVGDLTLAAPLRSPTNLIVSADGRTLYAGQGGAFAGGRGAAWTAFRVEGRSLRRLNAIDAGGVGPTHGMVDRRGRYLVTTNFSSNEVMAYRLSGDGAFLEQTARVAPSTAAAAPPPPGTPLPPLAAACYAVDRTPQADCRTKPHIALFSPSERWVVTAEIATDRVAIYRFDAATGGLSLHALEAGPEHSGPRHLVWSPDGRFLYSSDEHSSTVTAWRWDEGRGRCRAIQTLSTLPRGFSGANTTAHIAIHPSGQSLWVSNRGHPSLAGFRIDRASGRLVAAGHTLTHGRDCWCFDIDPTGRWLVAGIVTNDQLLTYAIDPRSSRLTPSGQPVAAPFPTCVRFATQARR